MYHNLVGHDQIYDVQKHNEDVFNELSELTTLKCKDRAPWNRDGRVGMEKKKKKTLLNCRKRALRKLLNILISTHQSSSSISRLPSQNLHRKEVQI